MELASVLDKIRGLIAKAESLEVSKDPHAAQEAMACRERADMMMQKYAVEEWQIMAKAPVAAKPTRIKIEIGDADNPFLTEMATLVNIISNFCKCSSVWMVGSGFKVSDKITGESSYSTQEYCWVYGYESDLRYFELLYTSLFLHMSGAIFPKPDPLLSLELNVYELHNAGLNWFDIAKAYGWYQVPPLPHEPPAMYVNRETGARQNWTKTIGVLKKAYQREIAKRGEQFLRIPPNGSLTYRRNAAQGYLARIGQRLREIAGQRGSGTEIVLADKSQNIAAAIADAFPNSRAVASKQAKFNATAYAKGTRHANTASLNPEAKAAERKAL